jgi:hypothetical protein
VQVRAGAADQWAMRLLSLVFAAFGRNGEPATRITGKFDPIYAFKALSGVSSLGQNDRSTPDLEQLRDHLGAARTLFVSDRTHLLVGGLITLEVEVDGNEMSFDVSYRLTSVNQPVRFPA